MKTHSGSFNKLLLPAVAIAALSPLTVMGTLVVNLNGTDGFAPSGQSWGTNASSALKTTTIADDTVESIMPYGTALLTAGSAPISGYTGPDLIGGVYINSIWTTSQVGQMGSFGQTFNVPPNVIRFRRNGGGTLVQAGSILRLAFTFVIDSPGNYTFDADSVLSMTGNFSTNISNTVRWLAYSDGTLYVSQTAFNHSAGNSSNITFSLNDGDTVLWAEWSPDTDLSLDSLVYDTAGTSLTDITRVGFYYEKTGRVDQNTEVSHFTADLAAVPEPQTYAMMIGAFALVLTGIRRRAHKTAVL